jgi:hypothetical protein
MEDMAWENEMVLDEDIPRETIEAKDIMAGRSDLADVNPYVAYLQSPYLVSYRCCPRKQNYGCRSIKRRLPCYYDYSFKPRAVCCPVYPSWAIYAAYCNCNKCAVLTPYCASVGRCLRRYAIREITYICFTNPHWVLKKTKRAVPTSCYCRTYC